MANHPIFAALCDTLMAPMGKLRAPVISQARGRTLEIGFGTGLNLQHYEDIHSLDVIEPDPHMCTRARRRIKESPLSVTLHPISAEELPFKEGHFDTIVCTWTLCTIPNAKTALKEMFRVLKPGGLLLYAEHVAASNQPERLAQTLLNPIWRVCAAGCNLNRDSVNWIEEAGFVNLQNTPKGWQRLNLVPIHVGTATKGANGPLEGA